MDLQKSKKFMQDCSLLFYIFVIFFALAFVAIYYSEKYFPFNLTSFNA